MVSAAQAQPSLKEAFKDAFRVGAALNRAQYEERDARGLPLIDRHFNSITPENDLKWERVHPQPGTYDFAGPDRYVAFGEKHKMFIVGHTLVWHSQTPAWVFQDAGGAPVTRQALLDRMRDHIRTVVGRYKGRIHGWDVVNEALNEDGTLRQSPWMKIIGEDYIAKAFEWAHEADPAAELYYNDYSIENEAKRNGAVALVKKLLAQGIAVKGVGIQGHDNLTWPTAAQMDASIAAFAGLGLKVHITELDISVLPNRDKQNSADVANKAAYEAGLNPYTAGLPDAVQQAQAQRYAELFAVFVKHRDAVERVTFWGVTDGDSWLNNFPIRGRTNYPLLFDRKGEAKAALDAVLRTAPR